MSSDSDSDICDFTTDVSKKMSKGFNQFWQNYKQKDKGQCSKTSLDDTVKDPETVKESIADVKINNSIVNLDDTSEVIIQTDEENVQNRIRSKLDQLVAEINTIVQKNRKRKPKQAQNREWAPKRGRNTRRSSLSRPNIKTVTLSSDDESKPSMSLRQNISNIQSNDELNPIVDVTVLWKSVDKNTFKVPKYQSLSCIPKYYVDKCKVNPKLLFFTLDDKQINLDNSSYVSLRLDDTKIVEGGILPESYLEEAQQSASTTTNQDTINFKVQCSDRRNNDINVCCKKDDKMEIIFWKVANSVERPVENIKLFFDGDSIQPHSKISDLDLEEGDCIDLEISN